MKYLLLVTALALSSLVSAAPSFECGAASTLVEQSICQHEALGRMNGGVLRVPLSLTAEKVRGHPLDEKLSFP